MIGMPPSRSQHLEPSARAVADAARPLPEPVVGRSEDGVSDGEGAAPAPVAAPTARGRPNPLLALYPALGVPAFRLLWLGSLPATLAWQMSVVAIGYAALVLSGSATALGLVGVAMGVPMLFLALVGGVVADQFSGRTVLLAAQTALAVATAALTALAFADMLEVWHLAGLAFVQGIAFSFNMPSRQAFTAQLVGPRLVRNAVALNNAGINFCRVAGPALAGALLAVEWIGVRGVFAAMTAMYGVVLVSLFGLPSSVGDSSAARAGPTAGGWERLVEGLSYIRSSPVLLALLGMAALTLFFGMPFQQLMPVFSERVFAVGAWGLGVRMAANGAGALLGSLAVATLSIFPRQALLQIGFGAAFGLSLVGFALAPGFLVAVVWLALVGFASAAYLSLNNTLVMSNTEPRLYGRVMSVYLLTFAITPVAALPQSWVAEVFGGRVAVAAAGALVTAVVVGAAILYPPYRRVD